MCLERKPQAWGLACALSKVAMEAKITVISVDLILNCFDAAACWPSPATEEQLSRWRAGVFFPADEFDEYLVVCIP